MTSNTYASKKEFHAFSHAASAAFNTKLSTTQQKLAKEEGYKNANALLASLPSEITPIEPKQFEVSKLTPNDIYKKPWSSSGTFTATASDARFMPTTVIVNAPLYLSVILDGKVFEDPEILCQPLYIEDTEQTDKYTKIWIKPASFDAVAQYRLIFPAAVVQSSLNPNYVITSEETLKTPFLTNKGSVSLASMLIEMGSVKQFNVICRMPKLVEELDLLEQITERYYNQVLNLCHNEGDFAEVLTGMPYLDQTYSSLEFKNSVIRELAHPLEAVEGCVDKLILEPSDEVSSLEEMFMLHNWPSSSPTDAELERLGHGESFLLASRIKLQRKLSKRNYELTELESNLMKHLEGFFIMHGKHVNHLIKPLKGDEELRNEVVYYHLAFNEMHNLLTDIKMSAELLTFKTGLKEGHTVLSIMVNESISFLDSCLQLDTSHLQSRIDRAQQLFKSVPEELLKEPCDIYSEFESIPLKKGTYTFSEALGTALKHCRASQ